MSRRESSPAAARRRRRRAAISLAAAAFIGLAPAVRGEPTVVPTAEGQLGQVPGADDELVGTRFESIRGMAGDVLLASLFVFDGGAPPPPEIAFLKHTVHGDVVPAVLDTEVVSFFDVFPLAPASARSRNASDDGDFVAFSFATDGTMADTLAVRLVTFDETGSQLATATIDNLPTFTFPDPSISDVDVAVDDQGRSTVVYTKFEGGAPEIKAARFDGSTGSPIDLELEIDDLGVSPDLAILVPNGDRVIVVSADVGASPTGIQGNIIDFTGPTPVVSPEFPIDDTSPAFGDINPVVAADPATGVFTVAWENVTGATGDPVNIRARRFDAAGNPVGPSFQVNSTSADAQGQPSLAFGPGGELVIVWAGDPLPGGDGLEVFAQAYDAAGSPIDGEIRVNSAVTDDQDRPSVRFLPEPDPKGRPQFVVTWRDTEDAFAGKPANGTGTGYRCFSIDEDPSAIFSDGFESGDTTSWSSTQE